MPPFVTEDTPWRIKGARNWGNTFDPATDTGRPFSDCNYSEFYLNI